MSIVVALENMQIGTAETGEWKKERENSIPFCRALNVRIINFRVFQSLEGEKERTRMRAQRFPFSFIVPDTYKESERTRKGGLISRA